MARPSHLRAGERFPESRAAPRYPLTALVTLTEPLNKRNLVGWTSVISLTGCFVRTMDALTAGTMVRLRIERDESTFETWAQIAHVRPNDGVGLVFFDTAQTQTDVLLGWVAELAQRAEKTMTALEIEKAARQAGFDLTGADHPARLIFTRGPQTLIVNSDATWCCQSGVLGKTVHGYSFESLAKFLAEFPRKACAG